jgi:hypothetical protein
MKFNLLYLSIVPELLLADISNFIMKPFKADPKVEQIMAIIIFPILLSVKQVNFFNLVLET